MRLAGRARLPVTREIVIDSSGCYRLLIAARSPKCDKLLIG